jgi:hypothetical protein
MHFLTTRRHQNLVCPKVFWNKQRYTPSLAGDRERPRRLEGCDGQNIAVSALSSTNHGRADPSFEDVLILNDRLKGPRVHSFHATSGTDQAAFDQVYRW